VKLRQNRDVVECDLETEPRFLDCDLETEQGFLDCDLETEP